MGAMLVGSRLLVWADSPRLVGAAAWGAIEPAELERAMAIWETLWPRLAHGAGFVIDIARLEPPRLDAYALYADFVRAQIRILSDRQMRQLTLTPTEPTGFVTVLTSGFTAAVQSYPHHLTHDPAAGARWLGDEAAAARIAEARAIVEESLQATRVLREVRQRIARDPRHATLDEVARALAMSPRTLQRALDAEATSFRHELVAARMALAERLLAEGDVKIADVAAQVGFASAPHFASVFGKTHGVTPAAFRRSRRGPPAQ